MATPKIKQTIENQENRINRNNVVKHIYHPLRNKLFVPTSTGIHLVTFERILRIESESNYSWVFLDDGKKHLVARTLKNVHSRLPQNHFIRVHNSHVVNASKIALIEKNGIVLSDGQGVPVSRKFKNELQILLNEIKY